MLSPNLPCIVYSCTVHTPLVMCMCTRVYWVQVNNMRAFHDCVWALWDLRTCEMCMCEIHTLGNDIVICEPDSGWTSIYSFHMNTSTDLHFHWEYTMSQLGLQLTEVVSLPVCLIDSVSSQTAPLYFSSIEHGRFCYSKWWHSIWIPIHSLFHV